MDRTEDSRSSSDTNADHDFVTTYCQVLKFTDPKGNTKEMYFPKNLDLERPKRSRTNFTIKQLNELEKAFAKNQYLVGKERKSLSKQLDLSEAQIKIWYQNRRTKHKKDQSKEKERLAANAESIAATNILTLLEQQQSRTQTYPPTPQLSSPPELDDKSSNSCCLSSPESSHSTSSINTFNPMLTTNVNPFFYSISNSHWNSDTNYLSSVYLPPTLLHK